MKETIIDKLLNRAVDTANRMNEQAKDGDIMRNNVNCGALTEIIYMLNQIGIDIEECTWKDGDYFKCAKIKVSGKELISFED